MEKSNRLYGLLFAIDQEHQTYLYRGPYTAHFELNQTSETLLSVNVKMFNYTFNPWDLLIWEVQFQQYYSIVLCDKEMLSY